MDVGTVSVFLRVIVRSLLAGTVMTGGAQAPLLFAAQVAFPLGSFAESHANPHIGTTLPSGNTVVGYLPAIRFTVDCAEHTAAARRRMVTANAALFRVAFIKVDCIFLSLLTELR
jgi:hypothetical protein